MLERNKRAILVIVKDLKSAARLVKSLLLPQQTKELRTILLLLIMQQLLSSRVKLASMKPV